MTQAITWRPGISSLKTRGFLDYSAFDLSLCALSKVGAEGEGADFDRALTLCIKSLKSDIKNPEIYFNLAKIYLLSGKKTLAVKAVEKGLNYDAAHGGLRRLHERN